MALLASGSCELRRAAASHANEPGSMPPASLRSSQLPAGRHEARVRFSQQQLAMTTIKWRCYM